MSQTPLTEAELNQFTGSDHWYRHHRFFRVFYSEGVRYVAEEADANWLVNEIASAQAIPAVEAEGFQHWKLKVDLQKQCAVLFCEDRNGKIVHRQEIDDTNFPNEEIGFYFVDNSILLPREY